MRIVEALGEGFGETAVVAGWEADRLGEALRRAGAPTPVVGGDRLAVLSSRAVEGEASRLADLPAGFADLVILRRAWRDRLELGAAIRQAARIARSGGRLLAADLDFDRLVSSSSFRYPSRLQYGLLSGRAAPRSLRMALSIEVGRAGFESVDGWEVDEEDGVYEDARAYWEAVRAEGWPVFAELSVEEAEQLLERASEELRRVAPVGPVVDRRPWFVVSGLRR